LINGSLIGVVTAIEIARATMRNIHQNLFGAFVYNTLGIPVATGLLYPFFGGAAQPDPWRSGEDREFRYRGNKRQSPARLAT